MGISLVWNWKMVEIIEHQTHARQIQVPVLASLRLQKQKGQIKPEPLYDDDLASYDPP
nr:hypothetical protein [Tanacetum cinerariifolium]